MTLISKKSINELDESDLKILFSKDNIKVFRDIFKKEFKDLNSTGLILMHHPINMDKYSNSNTTLLNGDVNLKNLIYPKYIVDKWHNNYGPRKSIFQIPHHGAMNNWDINFFEKHKHYYQFYSHFIINFGWGNAYGHPSEIVLSELKKYGYKLVNQFENFSYEIDGE